MTPQQFIAKWQRANLSERSACQQHFLDLCELLDQPKPAEADPDGDCYTFEKGVKKTEGGDGSPQRPACGIPIPSFAPAAGEEPDEMSPLSRCGRGAGGEGLVEWCSRHRLSEDQNNSRGPTARGVCRQFHTREPVFIASRVPFSPLRLRAFA